MEIIVPANTYIASILSITRNKLTPVLVEPELRSYNIDPEKIEQKITSETKAILVVHLYGQAAQKGVDWARQQLAQLFGGQPLVFIRAAGSIFARYPAPGLVSCPRFLSFPAQSSLQNPRRVSGMGRRQPETAIAVPSAPGKFGRVAAVLCP